MLLVWLGKSTQTSWKIGKRKVKLSELKDALKDYWESIAPEYPNIDAIEIILIDCTARGYKSQVNLPTNENKSLVDLAVKKTK